MSKVATMKGSVRVPASTSNLGAGFDCVGVAVDRWLTASVVASEEGGSRRVTMKRSGSLANLDQPPDRDLVHAGFTLVCEARQRPLPKHVAYDVGSTIPVGRGLGSSSAALIAGAMLASESLGLDLDRDEIAALCAHVEGHADNVGPAVFGGAVLGVATKEREYAFSSLQLHPNIALVFVVPELEIATSAARALLPASLPYRTTVAAIAKAAALVQGLKTGEAALLAYALDDVVHVPFRRAMLPGYDSVVEAAVAAGAFGATLSGSGSAIVAITPIDSAARVGSAMQTEWRRMSKAAEVIIGSKPVSGATSG